MQVKITTNHGAFTLQLYADKAPATVENFVNYVKSGFYTGTLFHRVIKNFMVQGGGLTAGMKNKPTNDPVKNEADNGVSNGNGTVAMARTNDPHSATAQFFINVTNNDFLNHTAATPQGWGYCVFAEVVEGMDIITAIKGLKTHTVGGHQDVPVDDVIIESAEVIED